MSKNPMGPLGSARNHLLKLAQPLFCLLDELSPELESAARLDTLKSEARTRLATFRSATQAACLKSEAIEAVHYCFCAALDQAGSHVRGRADALRGVWLQHGLLTQFYGERSYGARCRDWLAKLQEAPNASENALEVISQLMDRGLRDERGMPLPKVWPIHQPRQALATSSTAERQRHCVGGAPAAVEQQRIHVALSRPVAEAQTPGVLITVGMPAPEMPSVQTSPSRRNWGLVVIAAIVLALVLGLAFFAYRQHLDNQALKSQVGSLSAQVERQQSLEDRIAHALATKAGANQFGLSTEGERVYVVFSSDLGFSAGSADITPTLARQLGRLATVLADAGGKMTIVGHTDDSPGVRSRTETNLALSAARAMAVGRYLQAHGVAESRIATVGRGAKEPVGDNRTAAGRALNRRVEIVLENART